MDNAFTTALEKHTEAEWMAAVASLLPSVHEVDRNAVQIWFRFYPLDLVRYLETADDLEAALKGINLQGDFGLVDKIDSSHRFLFGHRYWPKVKDAVIERAASDEPFTDLLTEITSLAKKVAGAAMVKEELVTAICAVGLMTLNQAGLDSLTEAKNDIVTTSSRSADEIVADRAKDDSQGLLGFLRTVNKEYTVAFDAFNSDGKFKIISEEEIASASQKDHTRNWQSLDSRCWDGPVPIECTSASCGTCWIGVVGGQEKLSEPSARERRQMKVFGYGQTDEEKPFIRLACQAKATGNVSVVIPPWNAVFGKKVRGNVDDVELEPVTTSAKKLRETIASATSVDQS